jgi:hypothetical protein
MVGITSLKNTTLAELRQPWKQPDPAALVEAAALTVVTEESVAPTA